MKLLIIADIEGIAGVTTREQCIQGNAEYQAARQLMLKEVNAVASGATQAGATDIVVVDSHGPMINLAAEGLSPEIRLLQGKPRAMGMIDGIQHESFDALVMVGAHMPAGCYGVLAHTINSRAFRRIDVNVHVMGEVDLYGSIAAEYGVPLVLASGDHLLATHVAEAFPGCEYVTVKQARGCYAADNLSPTLARKHLTESTWKALSAIGQVQTSHHMKPPYAMTVSASSQALADLYALVPGVERISPDQVSYTADSFAELVRLLNSFSAMSSSLT